MRYRVQKKAYLTRSVLILLCSFLLPGLLLALMYMVNGFYPFGEKSLLIMDLSDQYVEFYSGLFYYGENSNVLFSWSKGYGQNYIGLFAYYLSSPFSILVLLFPQSEITVALLWINLLKVACCGLTFAVFLHEWSQRWDWTKVFFSTAYALMSYNIVYSMCLMWLDGVIWLPIVLCGVLRVLRRDRPCLLFAAFAVLFVSNYYISYMVVLFAVLFFLYMYFGEGIGAGDRRVFVRKLLYCTGCVLLAAGVGAWLLWPTLVSLFQGKISSGAGGGAITQITLFSPQLLFGKLMSGQYDSITNSGLPSIYCSSAALLLCSVYFMSSKISVKARLWAGGILLFILLSFWIAPLDLMWHVFQQPNWFPFRYAFVFGFFVLFLASRGALLFVHLSSTQKTIVPVLALVLFMTCDMLAETETPVSLFWSIALAGTTIGALWIRRHRLRALRACAAFLATALLSAELMLNGVVLLQGLDRQFGYKDEQGYRAYQTQLQTFVGIAKDDAADELFYRTEKDFERSKNDAIGAGYNGITHYSSAYHAAVNRFTPQVGLSQSYFWNSYYGATPVTDALFSVRYTITRNAVFCPWYEELAVQDTTHLLRNTDALPIAFVGSLNALNSENKSGGDVFAYQEQLLTELAGSEETIWAAANQIDKTVSNASETASGAFTVFRKNAVKTASVEYVFRTTAEGPLYAYFPTVGTSSCLMSVNDVYRDVHFTTETNGVVMLGNFRKGEKVTVRFKLQQDQVIIGEPIAVTLLESPFRDLVTQLKKGGMQLSSFKVTEFRGTVAAAENGVLYTSVPYDSGWRVKIDGKNVQTFAYQDTWLMAELPAGEHTVEFSYSPQGYAAGLTITILCMLLLLLIAVQKLRKYRAKHK